MQPPKFELKLAFTYGAIAVVWIILSDTGIARFNSTVVENTLFSLIKGLSFVFLTSALLYIVLKREMSKRRVVEQVLRKEITANRAVEDQLHTSEAQFRTLIEAMDDMVYTLDIDQCFTGTYGSWLDTLGTVAEDYLGRTAYDVYDETIGAIHERANLKALSGERVVFEWTLHTTHGEIDVQTRLSPIFDDVGGIQGIVGVGRDISDLKAVQHAATHMNRIYRTLSDCNQAVIHATNEENLLQRICDILIFRGAYRMVWVGMVIDRTQPHIESVASAGHESGYLQNISITVDDTAYSQGPTGRAVLTGVPQVSHDIQSDPNFSPWREQAIDRGYASSIALPLRVAGKVVGALNVYAAQPDAFNEKEQHLLIEMASELGYGLESLRTRGAHDAANRQVRESEARYRAMFEEHQAVMLLIDADTGAIVDANPAASQFYGYRLSQLKTMRISDINVLTADEIREEMQVAVLGKRSYFQFVHRLSSGSVRQVEVRSGPVMVGGKKLLYSIVNDVTERRYAEDALRQSEERLRMVIHNMPVMLCAFDEQYNVISWNGMSERLTGYSAEEVYDGVHTAQMIFSANQPHRALADRNLLLNDMQQGIEWDIVCKDGSTRTISWFNISRDYPIPGWAAWVIGIDVTERVRSQRALEDSNHSLEQHVEARTAELLEARAAEHEQRLLAEALRDAANALNSTLDLQKVLDRILVSIGQVMPFDALNIMLVEEGDDKRIARCVRATGYEDRGLGQEIYEPRCVCKVPHFLRMFETQQPVLIRDTQNHDTWLQDSTREWIGSYAGAPIINDGQVIGFINIKSVMPGFFNAAHLERLKTFTDQVAIAVRNANLFERAGVLAAFEERQRLARDLHDAVTQTLFSANVVANTLQRIWRDKPERVEDGLQQLNTLTRGALAEMRTLLLELRPEAVVDMPVDRLFTQLVDAHTSRNAGQIDLVLEGQGDIPGDVKEVFFRVAQEALNNVDQHANASYIRVQLAYATDAVAMSITDNGSGFDKHGVGGGHHGLKIMEERAQTIDAAFDLNSRYNQGTTIIMNWTASHEQQYAYHPHPTG